MSLEVHDTLGMLYGSFFIYRTVVQEIGCIMYYNTLHVTAVGASPLVL